MLHFPYFFQLGNENKGALFWGLVVSKMKLDDEISKPAHTKPEYTWINKIYGISLENIHRIGTSGIKKPARLKTFFVPNLSEALPHTGIERYLAIRDVALIIVYAI